MSKCVIVTGGAQGIGLCCAVYFKKKGWNVFIADNNEDACKRASVRLDGTYFSITDVSDEESVSESVSRCVKKFGRVDSLINNAGIASPYAAPIEQLSLEHWNRVIGVNLTGVFLMTKHCVPHLREAKGSIINIASTRAFQSEKNTESYAASKGGIVALTHASAVSLGSDIRVNCISPGWINTSDYKNHAIAAEPTANDHAQHPVGRVGKAEDVASLAYFLTSDEAGFITGQNFTVDGGMTVKMIYSD